MAIGAILCQVRPNPEQGAYRVLVYALKLGAKMEQTEKVSLGARPYKPAAQRKHESTASAPLIDNSPQGAKLSALVQMVRESPQVLVQQELNAKIADSPYVTAQRKLIEGLSGQPAQRAEPVEEELLQGKFATIQRAEPEDEELLQGKFGTTQRAEPDHSPRANQTGLPDNLKSGIEALSGMSLDGVKVHFNSSQPAQLNALAYAQGSDIHLAPGQERHLPHEAWHVVQQAQGRVRPTMQLKDGVPVNDDAGLENEADVMGAKALDQSLQQPPLEGTVTNRSMNELVQRSVVEFGVDTVDYDPPGTDILETIDDADFTQTRKQISNKVRTTLNDPLVKTLSVPEGITATLEQSKKGAKHPDRQGSRSRNIGLIGRDEFWLKTGLVENFEGGHIIPHSLWDHDDNDVDFAGAYVNLVPMSRTLNVIDWEAKEKEIKTKLSEIDAGDQLQVDIDIGHQSYSLTNQEIADRFNLNISLGGDPNKANQLFGWNLASASVSWTHIDTGSEMEFSDVEENNLRNTHAEIDDVAKLIENLKASGFWIRMSETLKDELEGLL